MAFMDALRLAWMPGIHQCVGVRSATTQKYLRPEVVTPQGGPWVNGFSLYVGNPKESIEYFGHEADRFATAAFESVLIDERNSNYPRSIGWLIIRIYYAAFFSLHSLIRIHGWACTRLTSAEIQSLERQFNSLYSAVPALNAGIYLLRTGTSGVELNCQQLQARSGGSHEALWSVLPTYLADLGNCALTGPQGDHQELVSAISDFTKLVDAFGGPMWFTRMRNEINYSHARGAWFPYSKSTTDNQRVGSQIEGWMTADRPILAKKGGNELEVFASACTFLLTLCRLSIHDLARRSRANSPFRKSSALLLTNYR